MRNLQDKTVTGRTWEEELKILENTQGKEFADLCRKLVSEPQPPLSQGVKDWALKAARKYEIERNSKK